MSFNITISNTCSHPEYHCHDCDNYIQTDDYTDQVCQYCGGENIEYIDEDLDCDCFEYDTSYLKSELARLDFDTQWLYVGSNNMGWRNRSGWTIIDANELGYDTMSINGEWTQNWIYDGQKLTVVQYHHDSPTGESYIIRPATLAEICTWDGHVEHDCPHEITNECSLVEIIDDDHVRFECGDIVSDFDEVYFSNF